MNDNTMNVNNVGVDANGVAQPYVINDTEATAEPAAPAEEQVREIPETVTNPVSLDAKPTVIAMNPAEVKGVQPPMAAPMKKIWALSNFICIQG